MDLTIHYDPERQTATTTFNPEIIKTWEMVLGILEMARIDATTKRQLGLAQAVQERQHFQMQNEILRRKVIQ